MWLPERELDGHGSNIHWGWNSYCPPELKKNLHLACRSCGARYDYEPSRLIHPLDFETWMLRCARAEGWHAFTVAYPHALIAYCSACKKGHERENGCPGGGWYR